MVFLPSLHAGVNEKKETLVGRTTKENGARTHKKAKKKEVSYTAEVGRAATDDTHAHTHTHTHTHTRGLTPVLAIAAS